MILWGVATWSSSFCLPVRITQVIVSAFSQSDGGAQTIAAELRHVHEDVVGHRNVRGIEYRFLPFILDPGVVDQDMVTIVTDGQHPMRHLLAEHKEAADQHHHELALGQGVTDVAEAEWTVVEV